MEKKLVALYLKITERNIKTEIKQLKVYDNENERLELAKKLEIASVSNIRANLKYYARRKKF